jgi:endonuclease/exonuclease/phosphatase family metal-dependent hydrolase
MKRTGLAASVISLAATVSVVAPPAAFLSSAEAAPGAVVKTASYNIQSAAVDRRSGDRRPWKERRAAVVATILSERPDVIGLQEASPAARPRQMVSARNQYLDLVAGLRRAGGNYVLTNPHAYNCKNSATLHSCEHKNRGASQAQRILYNPAKLQLLSQGARRYSAQENWDDPRHLVWAVFKVKATGKKFLFTNTHLSDVQRVTVAQWKQMISWTRSLANGRRVISVGDFNVHRRHPIADFLIPVMYDSGWGDTRDHFEPRNPLDPARAQVTVNGWINSFNHASRDVRRFSSKERRGITGNPIDWIFASNALEVKRWKVVVKYDRRSLKVIGTLPSDHNMVRADIVMK